MLKKPNDYSLNQHGLRPNIAVSDLAIRESDSSGQSIVDRFIAQVCVVNGCLGDLPNDLADVRDDDTLRQNAGSGALFEAIELAIPNKYKNPRLILPILDIYNNEPALFADWYLTHGSPYCVRHGALIGIVDNCQSRRIYDLTKAVSTLLLSDLHDLNFPIVHKETPLFIQFLCRIGCQKNIMTFVNQFFTKNQIIEIYAYSNVDIVDRLGQLKMHWDSLVDSDWIHKSCDIPQIERPNWHFPATDDSLRSDGLIKAIEVLKRDEGHGHGCTIKRIRKVFGENFASDTLLVESYVDKARSWVDRPLPTRVLMSESQVLNVFLYADLYVKNESKDDDTKIFVSSFIELTDNVYDVLKRENGEYFAARFVKQVWGMLNRCQENIVEGSAAVSDSAQKNISRENELSALRKIKARFSDQFDICDENIIKLAIKSAFVEVKTKDVRLEEVVTEAINVESLQFFRCGRCVIGDDEVCFQFHLKELCEAIITCKFSGNARADIAELVSNISNKAPSPTYCHNHPVARLFRSAADVVYPENPSKIKRLASDVKYHEKITPCIDYILKGYDLEMHPGLELLMGPPEIPEEDVVYQVYSDYEVPDKQTYVRLCPDAKELHIYADSFFENVVSLLRQNDTASHELHELMSEIDRLEYCNELYSEIYTLINDGKRSIVDRIDVFKAIKDRGRYRDPNIRNNFYNSIKESLVQLDGVASVCPRTYFNYVKLCEGIVLSSEYVKQCGKCLGLMRRRIRDDKSQEKWKVGEYVPMMKELVAASEYDRLLGLLLQAYRQLDVGNVSGAVQIQWNKAEQDIVNCDDKEVALNWLLANWLPRQYFSNISYPSMVNDEPTDAEQPVPQIDLAMCSYCSGALQLKNKQRSGKSGYQADQVKEPNTHWRRGLLNALAELQLDPAKRAHKLANFIYENDFDTETRTIARQVHDSLCRKKKMGSKIEMHRNYLAAFWWLRIARAKAGNIDLDMQLAKRWRRRELRHVKH